MRVPRSMLRHQVTVEVYKGSGAYGPVYDPPTTQRALVMMKRGRVVTQAGGTIAEQVYEAEAMMFPDATIAPESRLTYGARAYTVLTVSDQPGPSGGTHHISVTLR